MDIWMTDNFEANNWVIYSTTTSMTVVDPTTFDWTQFSSITTTPPTHAELSALPISSQGWQKVFDDWKAKGLIQ